MVLPHKAGCATAKMGYVAGYGDGHNVNHDGTPSPGEDPKWWRSSAPKARSIGTFLNASDAALTASAVIGPLTSCSSSAWGIYGKAAVSATVAAAFFLLGMHALSEHHVLPPTQIS